MNKENRTKQNEWYKIGLIPLPCESSIMRKQLGLNSAALHTMHLQVLQHFKKPRFSVAILCM